MISIDASGPTAADVPPDVRLVDAPHLQALREPTPALRLVPRRILQRAAPVALAARLRAAAGLGGGAVLVHLALGAAFVALLSFRDAEVPREVEIPVEVVTEPPKSPVKAAPKPAASGTGARADAVPAGGPRGANPSGPGPAGSGPAKAEPVKPEPVKPGPALLAAASPEPAVPAPTAPASTAPSQPQPQARAIEPAPPIAEARRPPTTGPAAAAPQPPPGAAAMPKPASAPPAGVPDAPKLVAPPPEPGRAATQAEQNKPANLVPDEHQHDEATREARPVAVPQVLTTPDVTAQVSVPAAARAKPAPADRPTPPTTAKVPSQADKLAALLPMDPGNTPSPFRSVLAGNAAAQLKAAYGGVVQGRIRQATAELSATTSAQKLSGAVVVSFTVDDAGGLSDLRVVQSSGNDRLDAMVLGAIRGVAPFPAPPPDSDHTFNKAFLIGK